MTMADYYLTRLRSSIRKVDENTIEVARFENGSLRWVLWFTFGLMLFFFLRSWWQQDELWENVRMWLDSDRVWYEDYQKKLARGSSSVVGVSFEDFKRKMLSLPYHKYTWIAGMNYVLTVVFTFYLAFLINLRPVRFNRKYGVAYTYNFWGFFISDAGPECRNLQFERRVIGSNRPAARFDSGVLAWGGLYVYLRSYRFPWRRRPWMLGCYPALYAGQNDDIAKGIRSFMCDPDYPAWVDQLERQPPLRTWRRLNQIAFNFTLRPLFWPKRKTERLIQQHIARRSRR